MARSRAFTTPSRGGFGGFGGGGDDPLSLALRPPANEDPEARAARQKAEAQAKARSDEIDSAIQAEKDARKKRKPPVKVLLLGQSESGKSTTLKNFQLAYARKTWAAEREAWRAVIQLNIVRAVNTIADAVARELARNGRTSSETDEGIADMDDIMDDDDDDLEEAGRRVRKPDETVTLTGPGEAGGRRRPSNAKLPASGTIPLSDTHRTLLAALNPLRAVQRNLELRLGAGAVDEDDSPAITPVASEAYDAHGRMIGFGETSGANTSTNASTSARVVGADLSGPGGSGTAVSFRDITNGPTQDTATPARSLSMRRRRSQEFFVHAGGWKSAVLQRLGRRSTSDKENDGTGFTSMEERNGVERDAKTIAALRTQMRVLWADKSIREILKLRGVRLFDSAEYLLNAVDRIAAPKYSPTDADIMRARLRTVGVQEHSIVLDSGPEPGREWLIYDVGGARSARAQWAPFFDDVHAILFLAPIHAFDLRLAEDARVNRLDDSLQLWRTVCSHKLLARVELVLFLNKCDLLEKKVRSGVKFSDYVKSYDQPNEATAVGKWLKQRFADMCRHYSKESRGLHIHFTSVIDTEATAKTLTAVQDGILRGNLRNLDLI